MVRMARVRGRSGWSSTSPPSRRAARRRPASATRPYPESVRTPDLSATRGRKRSHLGIASQVSGSQLLLAASGYIVLAMGGQLLNPVSFAAVTSFYLLLNTIGRGLCAAIELHLTRAVAHDRSIGRSLAVARRVGIQQTAALLGLALVVVILASPVITRSFAQDVLLTALLAAAMPGMAYAYLQRGLLAGSRRYGRYALSFIVEGITTLVFGGAMLTFGVHDRYWWALALMCGSIVSVLTLWTLSLRGPTGENTATRPVSSGRKRDTTSAAAAPDLVWSVVVLTCVQGVWNLAPVILTWRLAATPEVAAGFTSMALILRVPVLLFPAAQALLLPVLTANAESARARLRAVSSRVIAAGICVVALWGFGATVVVPVVVRVVFGQHAVPSTAVALILAAASVLGGGGQLLQTALVAQGRYRRSGLGWVSALVVLVLLGTLLPASDLLASVSLAVATLTTVLVFMPRTNR